MAVEKQPHDVAEEPRPSATIGTAGALADVAALDKYHPLFGRMQALAEGCDDAEMAIGIDLMNDSLHVYGQLKLSASDSLKDLLESLGSFFGGDRRAVPPPAP
jgi:hypothetical protein